MRPGITRFEGIFFLITFLGRFYAVANGFPLENLKLALWKYSIERSRTCIIMTQTIQEIGKILRKKKKIL